MSNGKFTHRVTRLAITFLTALMLVAAPIALAGDGGPVPSIFNFFGDLVESLTEAIEDALDGADDRTAGFTDDPDDGEPTDEDDGGTPDYNPNIDPNG